MRNVLILTKDDTDISYLTSATNTNELEIQAYGTGTLSLNGIVVANFINDVNTYKVPKDYIYPNSTDPRTIGTLKITFAGREIEVKCHGFADTDDIFLNYESGVLRLTHSDAYQLIRWSEDRHNIGIGMDAHPTSQLVMAVSPEIYGPTPYIDFHYNNDSGDYTHRLIADNPTHLKMMPGLNTPSIETQGLNIDGHPALHTHNASFMSSGVDGRGCYLFEFMQGLWAKCKNAYNNGLTGIPFRCKAANSWSPTGAEAWIKGTFYPQNLPESTWADMGVILAMTGDKRIYLGQVDNGATGNANSTNYSVSWTELYSTSRINALLTQRAVIVKGFTSGNISPSSDGTNVQVAYSIPSGYSVAGPCHLVTNGFIGNGYVVSWTATSLSCWVQAQYGRTPSGTCTAYMIFVRNTA